MPSNSDKQSKTIAFLVFGDVKLLDIAGALQVFADANLVRVDSYKTVVISMNGGQTNTDTVLSIPTERAADWLNRKVDTLIIAGGPGARAASQDAGVISQVRAIAARCERVGSICTGAFVLAAAGLLDGRRAVTHWESCMELARAYPRVRVETDPIFIKHEHIWTSAGVTAGIDMALAMVTEDFGRPIALALARLLVTYMVRPGGQSQFSAALDRQIEDSSGRFDKLHCWIGNNLQNDLRVEQLAEQANMSPRNFARVYTAHTSQSPAKAVERMRAEAARQLLEDTDLPVTVIAERCGFGDDERLRRALHRTLNVSPSDYRQRFKVPA